MEIKKLSEYHGSEKYGTCMECGKSSKDDSEMIKIIWNENGTTSTIMCKECAQKLKNIL